MPSTIRLHRVFRSTPERLYRAFLDPDALVKWIPPNGFTGKIPPGWPAGWLLQDVFHQLHDREEPLLRRGLSRIGAKRTDSAYGQVRRSEFTRHDAGDDNAEEGVMWD